MSFRCQNCSQAFAAGERPTRTVVETRPKTYHEGQRDSYGFETVRELLCCNICSIKVGVVGNAEEKRAA